MKGTDRFSFAKKSLALRFAAYFAAMTGAIAVTGAPAMTDTAAKDGGRA